MKQTCPVCSGRGFVPGNFYSNLGNPRHKVTCKSCDGTGIVDADTKTRSSWLDAVVGKPHRPTPSRKEKW